MKGTTPWDAMLFGRAIGCSPGWLADPKPCCEALSAKTLNLAPASCTDEENVVWLCAWPKGVLQGAWGAKLGHKSRQMTW